MTNAAAAGAAAWTAAGLDALTSGQYAEMRLRVGRLTRLTGTDLDEVVQASALRVLRSGVVLQSEEHLYACVLRASRWVVSNERRRRPLVPLHDVDERDLRPVADPLDVVMVRFEAHRVLRALRRVGPRQRDVVWLHDVEDQTRAEVAAVLGMTTNAVDVALSRGRRSLRRLLSTTSVVSAIASGVRVLRPRAHPVTFRVAAVMTLVVGPVGVGLAGRWDVGRPLEASRVVADGDDFARHDALSRPSVAVRHRATPRRASAAPSVGRPRADADRPVGARLCITARPVRSCAAAGAGGTVPAVAGDTLYVIVPGSLAGGEDVPVYVRQDSVPMCENVPSTDYSGCRHHDPNPSNSGSVL